MKRLLVLILTATMLASGMTPAFAASKTRLTIKADFADGSGVKVWSLVCDKSTGNHPNRKAACALLKQKGVKLFKPVAQDALCTMIYGGDQRVTVTGLVANRKVKATFTRVNGCEIARYEAAAALFPTPAPVGQLLTGSVTLDGTATTGTVIFTNGKTSIAVKATEMGFQVRLPDGTWTGSAGVGVSCQPVLITIPAPDAPVAISCTSNKS